MTSSPHGPYGLGYTRATMAITIGSKAARRSESGKIAGKSPDCSLQLENMKLESLVIADQHAAVNTYSGPVHTARHTMGIGFARSIRESPITLVFHAAASRGPLIVIGGRLMDTAAGSLTEVKS